MSVAVPELRVNELYDRVTIQGEGPATGRRCTFVRLYGCNLDCAWCDTAFTWDTDGRNGTPYPMADNMTRIPVERVVKHVLGQDVDLCVVTGGEPLLQRPALESLARKLRNRHVDVHVETNGTMPPVEGVGIFYVVSPKLPGAKLSAGAARRALNDKTLSVWALYARRGEAVFKFVVTNRKDLDAAGRVCEQYDIPRRARWVMPEGTDPELLYAGAELMIGEALARGFSVSDRLHVRLWGTERGR